MENQRIRISKTMLKSGLIKLLKEKPLSQISVYELCSVSQINRTTFYKYYGSPLDLLCEIESDFLSQMDEEMKAILAHSQDAILPVLDHLHKQRELFCILVQSVPAQEFAAHLFAIPSVGAIFQSMTDKAGHSSTQAKYIRQFVFQGTFSVLYSWLSSDEPEPVAEIANVLAALRGKLWQEGIKNV